MPIDEEEDEFFDDVFEHDDGICPECGAGPDEECDEDCCEYGEEDATGS